MGGAEVLGPAECEGTGGTRGAEETHDAGGGTVTDGAVETRIWALHQVLQGDHQLAHPLLGL